ncbi:tRNA-dihydrouridine(20) synthase [NAD(P)+]-like [Hibiscus syriacus]|uniref:tRNA-dihydrouridine(20) synthase [NAD(P)+]-like n=1 Tax=Hibiscus syriacus TaxID=106335 RepID=UPI001920660B|nr:tRNA-dihydrouridine(20) synthase [NAD(P)+]-like [Hibiscus syriacus]
MGTSDAVRAPEAAQIVYVYSGCILFPHCHEVEMMTLHICLFASSFYPFKIRKFFCFLNALLYFSRIICRKVLDRPRDPAKWNEIADVVSALSIPVIANGDVFEYDDFERVKVARGASSVMAARGALWNASIFSPEGKADWEDVKREYVRKSVLWDNDVKSTKHTLKEMVVHYSCLEHPEGKAVIKSQSLADLAKVYGVEEYYQLVSGNRFSLDGQTA